MSETGLTKAAADVLAERRRQIEVEGWTVEHDDQHSDGEMAGAAVCYVANAACLLHPLNATPMDAPLESFWTWDLAWWKPSPENPRRDLVKAGALILAEIERLDRASAAAARVVFNPIDHEQTK